MPFLPTTNACLACLAALLDCRRAVQVDFKTSAGETEPFPDLSVREVKEIVSTGGMDVGAS